MNDSLLTAIGSWLAGSTEFATMFPGGAYNTTGPVGTVTPYVVFSKSATRTQKIIGQSKWVEWVSIDFELRASLGSTAETLLEQFRDFVLRDQPRLAWINGRESGRYVTEGQTTGLDDGLGIDGADVWVSVLPITFVTARG